MFLPGTSMTRAETCVATRFHKGKRVFSHTPRTMLATVARTPFSTTPAGPTSEPVAAERATLGLALGRGRRGQQGGKQPPITPESKGKKRAAEELPSQVPREKRAKGDGSLSPSKAFRGAGGVENNNTDNDQVQETLSWTTLSTKVHGMIDQGVKRQDVLSLLLATKWHHCAGLVRQVTRAPPLQSSNSD